MAVSRGPAPPPASRPRPSRPLIALLTHASRSSCLITTLSLVSLCCKSRRACVWSRRAHGRTHDNEILILRFAVLLKIESVMGVFHQKGNFLEAPWPCSSYHG